MNSICRAVLLFLLAFLPAFSLFGQREVGSGVQPAIAAPGMTISPASGDHTYRESVPEAGPASPTAIPLSLSDAINRGLKANLGLLTSDQASREARAQRIRALSGLLPSVNGQASITEQQLNLQALGFLVSPPPSAGFTIPNIVGPYSYQSALASAQIPMFDYGAISNFRAGNASLKAAVLTVKNARDLVVQAIGDAYLQIVADGARITATQAEIEADTAVYTNATRRHDAGTAIAIDV